MKNNKNVIFIDNDKEHKDIKYRKGNFDRKIDIGAL